MAEALFSEFPPVPTEAWEAQIRKDLRGASYEEALVWRPWNGFAVAPYYREEDLADVAPLQAAPGRLPYARRGAPEGNPWQIRQDILHEDPREANRLAREALEGGAEAIGFTLNAGGESGRGVRIRTTEDLGRLLGDIGLGAVPLHITADRPLEVGKRWADVASRRGLGAASLTGSLARDPADTWLDVRPDVEAVLDEATALARWALAEAPRLRVLAVDVRPRDGRTPVQEVGMALAAVSEYLAQLTERGLAVEEVTGRMHVAVDVGTSFLMEIAKLRALRLLTRRVVSAYAEGGSASEDVPITAFTSRAALREDDPHVNLVRGTTSAAAAVVGGCDALVVQPFDGVLGTPTGAAYRLARGTQLVLKHEAHLDEVADLAAGAYYVEVLTDKLARAAWRFFQEIERAGRLLRWRRVRRGKG